MSGFRSDFIWGAGSSAYQIEGAPDADGKGPSIWDEFCRRPGAIAGGESGDIACGGYTRFAQDIALLASLGAKAYRFSVSWPRVDPRGDGRFLEAGLAHYAAVADCCLAHGLEPWVTLYHWDLPAALEARGGWQSADTASAFGDYAGAVARALAGKVHHYITINEPECAVLLGYAQGVHAPGLRLDTAGSFACMMNLLLAHGLAARAVHAADPLASADLATTGRLCFPADPHSGADCAAARQETFALREDDWMFTHGVALDPVLLGQRPAAASPLLERLFAAVPDADLALMHTGGSLLCLNIYNGSRVRAGADGAPAYVPRARGARQTALGWPVTPEVMEWGPRFLAERYALPVVITENGCACSDYTALDGGVHDPDRIDFLTRYLAALRRAAEAGVDLRGYFHWSLTDNFEWHSGYAARFGLFYIDYDTLARLPKDSAAFYAKIIAANGGALPR